MRQALATPRYVAQGGDWGNAVILGRVTALPSTRRACSASTPTCRASCFRPMSPRRPRAAPCTSLRRRDSHRRRSTPGESELGRRIYRDGRSWIRRRAWRTRPQTLGYGLERHPPARSRRVAPGSRHPSRYAARSPATVRRPSVRNGSRATTGLDNTTLYWLTNTAIVRPRACTGTPRPGSACRLLRRAAGVALPVGV